MQIVTLPLSAILVEGRLREVDASRAAELAVSLRESKQITPIEVAPEDAHGMHRLIVGAHRVAAAKLAGMAAIQATIFEGSRDQERLREIDENLYRRELSPLDQAAFLTERRAIYERLFGAVKAGRRNSDKMSQLSFFDDVTGKFGLPRRMVERAIRRLRLIDQEVWRRLAGTRIAENGAMLDALARLKRERQAEVVEILLAGRAKTLPEAVVMAGISPAPDEATQQLKALRAAWRHAGAKAKQLFAAELALAHRAILVDALKKHPANKKRRAGEHA